MVTDRDDLIERITHTLKEPVRIDPSLDRKVMARIAQPSRSGVGASVGAAVTWLRRRRTVSVSPLGGLLAAAAVAATALIGARLLAPPVPTESPMTTALATQADTSVIQFVLVAPSAQTVRVVGDFNDWDIEATPLIQNDGQGVWSVTVPLEPGRYRYSFLVDGTTWLEDPHAAPALDDEFGRPNSVITVGGA